VNVAKVETANFSHARTAAVKKIMKNLAARQLAEGGLARRGRTMLNLAPKAQISGGEGGLILPTR
jgi:hypothetical protein